MVSSIFLFPGKIKIPISYQLDRGHLRIDKRKIEEDARFDGKWILLTNTDLPAEEVARKYKELWQVEQVFRDIKTVLETRPIFHQRDETIAGYVFCSFLALVLLKELERRIGLKGSDFEWADIKQDCRLFRKSQSQRMSAVWQYAVMQSGPAAKCSRLSVLPFNQRLENYERFFQRTTIHGAKLFLSMAKWLFLKSYFFVTVKDELDMTLVLKKFPQYYVIHIWKLSRMLSVHFE